MCMLPVLLIMTIMGRVSASAAFVLAKTQTRCRTIGVALSERSTSRSTHLPSLALSHNGNDSLDNDNHTTTNPQVRRTHKITWTTPNADDIVFHAKDGETLRTACLRRGKVSPHNGRARLVNCRGLGSCGTCAVELGSDSVVEPPERNAIEQVRLSLPPHSRQKKHNSKLRLACQVQVRGDLTVTKRTGFWGQGEGIAPTSEATTYFGELEYVLDRNPLGESTKN